MTARPTRPCSLSGKPGQGSALFAIAFCAVLLLAGAMPLSSRAQTAAVTANFSDAFGRTNGAVRVVFTPLTSGLPQPYFALATPLTLTRANYPDLTNGVVTTNLYTGVLYSMAWSDSWGTVTTNLYIPTNYVGTAVNAWNFKGSYDQTKGFAYSTPSITNVTISTNITIGATNLAGFASGDPTNNTLSATGTNTVSAIALLQSQAYAGTGNVATATSATTVTGPQSNTLANLDALATTNNQPEVSHDYISPVGGAVAINVADRQLSDNTTTTRVDWQNGLLYLGSGDGWQASLDWFNKTFPSGWNGGNITNIQPRVYFTNGLAGSYTLTTNASGYIAAWLGTNGLGSVAGAVTTNMAQTLYLGTNALSFANRMGISDPYIRSRLVGFENDSQKAGLQWADAVLLAPSYNPTNAKSWLGNSVLLTNFTMTLWGGYFSNSTVTLPLTTVAPSNTLVIVWRGQGNQNNSKMYLGSVADGNNSLFVFTVANGSYFYSLSNSVAIPNDLYFNLTGSNFMKQAGPVIYDNSYLANAWNRRTVMFISNDGQGNYTLWVNGIQGEFGSYLTLKLGQLTNSWSSLRLGYYGGTDPNSGFSPTKWVGEIAFAGVLNNVMNSNLAVQANTAVRWLEPSKVNRTWVGDSRFQTQLATENLHSRWSIPEHYDTFGARNYEPCIFDYSQSGEKTWQALAFSNSILVNASVGGPVESSTVWDNLGINDIYGDGNDAGTFFGNSTNLALIVQKAGAQYKRVNVWTLWTNAVSPYAYNATKEGYRTNLNNLIQTNRLLWDGYVDVAAYVTQDMLNTNNGYSSDGLHFNYSGAIGTNGWMVNRDLSIKLLTPQ